MHWDAKVDLIDILADLTALLSFTGSNSLPSTVSTGRDFARHFVRKDIADDKLVEAVRCWTDVDARYLTADGGGFMKGHMLDQPFSAGERLLLLQRTRTSRSAYRSLRLLFTGSKLI